MSNEINNNHAQQGPSGDPMPNMNVVKGLLAIIFGLMFVVFAAKIILNIIFFIAGVALVYYGLRVLNLRQATDYIEKVFAQLKRMFPSL